MIDFADLATIAEHELTRMLIAGELTRKHAWVAMKGGWKYYEAMRRGDVRGEDAALRCAATCRGCPSRTLRRVELDAGPADCWFCGPPFEELEDTCGCLVGITIGGEDMPAGKSLVASEHCQRGNW